MSTRFALPQTLALVVALTGCAGGAGPTTPQPAGPAPPAPAATVLPVLPADGEGTDGQTLLGAWQLRIDPEALTAEVTPWPHRASQVQGNTYDIDPALFLNDRGFLVERLAFNPAGDLELSFSHEHPFASPKMALPASPTNRADLGYTGRLLVLANTTVSPFFNFEVKLDPTLVTDPDGYLKPGNLIANAPLVNTNAFPYVLLVDEARDNRFISATGAQLSNNSQPSGNYSAFDGGWQRSNIGTGASWTGFDYLHAGQGITNSLTLSRAALQASDWSTGVAIVVKYTEPKSSQTYRLPPDGVPRVLDFAYRLPYAALDASLIAQSGLPPQIDNELGDSATLDVTVRDWDARATPATIFALAQESNIELVPLDSEGAPVLTLDFPLLSLTDPLFGELGGTGRPFAELQYQGLLTNTVGDAPLGLQHGLLRVRDPEMISGTDQFYHFGVDPVTLIPDATRRIPVETFQLLTVEVIEAAPSIQSVAPAGVAGPTSTQAQFSAVIAHNPTAWSWDFGGGCTPNTSTDSSPIVMLGAEGDYTGTLVATNARGDSTPYQFDYTIGPFPPQVVTVNPTPVAGIAGSQVEFSTTLSGGPATDWAWDFGTGASPQFSSVSKPTVTLAPPGDYSGTVTVTGPSGGTPFPFSYTVTPVLPIVLSVDPTGVLGSEGDSITFSANTVAPGTTWLWNFGGGATPDDSTDPSPEVTLNVPGEYQGVVIVGNAAGDAPPFFFAYTVGIAPVVLAIDPTRRVGGVGGEATFAVITAGDPPTDWAWSFGGGTDPPISDLESPVVSLTADGDFSGSVVVSNAAGTSDPFFFSYTIGPPNWEIHTLEPGGFAFPTGSVAYDQGAAVSYIGSDGRLKVAVSATTTPSSASDWQVADIDIAFPTRSALVVDSSRRLALAYIDKTGAPAFALAEDPGASSWTSVAIDSPNADWPSLCLQANGAPVLAYHHIDGGQLRVAFANSPDPLSPGDWDIDTVDGGFGDVGRYASIALSGADLVGVAYQDTAQSRLRYARHTDMDDWWVHTINSAVPNPSDGFYPSLSMANGQPVIAHADPDSGELRISLALVAQPTLDFNWITYAHPLSTLGLGDQPFLRTVDEHLVVSVAFAANGPQPSTLWVSRAAETTLPAVDNWESVEVDLTPFSGTSSSLTGLGDTLLVIYADETNGNLNIARSTEAW